MYNLTTSHLNGRNSVQSELGQQWTGGGQWAPETGQLATGRGAQRELSAPRGARLSTSGRGHLEHCAQPTHLRRPHTAQIDNFPDLFSFTSMNSTRVPNTCKPIHTSLPTFGSQTQAGLNGDCSSRYRTSNTQQLKTHSDYHVVTAEPLFIHKTIDCMHETKT